MTLVGGGFGATEGCIGNLGFACECDVADLEAIPRARLRSGALEDHVAGGEFLERGCTCTIAGLRADLQFFAIHQARDCGVDWAKSEPAIEPESTGGDPLLVVMSELIGIDRA